MLQWSLSSAFRLSTGQASTKRTDPNGSIVSPDSIALTDVDIVFLSPFFRGHFGLLTSQSFVV